MADFLAPISILLTIALRPPANKNVSFISKEEIKEIEEKSKFAVQSQEALFCENLKIVFKEALEAWNRFHAGKETGENLEELRKFKDATAQKIIDILLYPSENKDIQRIKKRIIKHNNELLTFLDHPEVEPTNNRAERGLRPSVIMRKIMFGNRSEGRDKKSRSNNEHNSNRDSKQ